MTEYFPGFDDYMAKAESRADAAYARKIILSLLKEWYGDRAKEAVREAGDELGWSWFNDTQGCPFNVYSRKLTVQAQALLKSAGFTRTPVWRAYFEVKAGHERDDKVALVFPIPGTGNWVVHNDFQLPLVPGYHVIQRQAASIDRGLVIAPFAAFLASLKETWSPWGA